MPRKLKVEGLMAELASIDALLQSAREYRDPIGEFQFSKKRSAVEAQIERLSVVHEGRASVALLFGGRPVLGSRGISAEFAGNMLEHFQGLVTRTFAATELGVLGERGPVPLRQATDLMVTSLARGSFGFVLNEMSDQDEIQDTALKSMVDEAVTILGKVASENERDFEEASESLDPRMLISLKDFFRTLDIAQATVRLVEDESDLSLDQAAVHRGRVRVEAISIEEGEEEFEGVLVGLLPEHRKFELRVSDLQTIYGTVSKVAYEQFSSMVSRGENPINQTWKVKVRRRTVTPLNRLPRDVYRLLEFASNS
jgi:hypothetical protein